MLFAMVTTADDPYKVGLLRSLPDADTRLRLFAADIYKPDEFKPAIKGCHFVFHMATPLQHNTNSSQAYAHSKTLAEKEVLSYCEKDNGGLGIVSLACGLVGGDTLLSCIPESMGVLISQVINDMSRYQMLRALQELLGKVPIAHIEDVSEAHIFCMEKQIINGRFLCASAYLTTTEIAKYYGQYCPDIAIAPEFLEEVDRRIGWGSTKLSEIGFEYKCDIKMILEDSVECGRRMGNLK
ncbi:hypothetical protein HHK36_029113 [Tetracentron sinense]|uniref:NAD-dependent epimerase/dehydratase domain-containing protein n=1 Tax=Tetracentron sinense TaxID=13715 RepID=A0A834YEB9_TETSI|nr:hypothetical protein HHK36_029113 [Tetracentron sinense]